MTLHAASIAPNRVLADLIPATKVNAYARDAVLVAAGAGLTGLAAQVVIPIPAISPVPFALSTLTVLLLGAALGPARAVASMTLYLIAGVAGMPWFAEGNSGVVGLLSFGYILGYIAAAGLVGALAKRGGDRTIGRTIGVMVAGSAVIYAFGVPYLMWAADMGVVDGLTKGAAVFIVTDVIKVAIAAALLPSAWALVRRFQG